MVIYYMFFVFSLKIERRVRKGKRSALAFFLLFLLLPAFLLSCSFKRRVNFPVDEGILYGFSKKSAAGVVSLAKNNNTAYMFENPVLIARDSSLEITYTVNGSPGEARVTLQIAGESDWEMPLDASLLTNKTPERIQFAVPVKAGTLQKLDFEVSGIEKKDRNAPSFEIKSIHIKKRWFGFALEKGVFSLTPFVGQTGGNVGAKSWLINPPMEYRIGGKPELFAGALFDTAESSENEDRITVEPGAVFFEWNAPHQKGNTFYLSAGMLPDSPYPLRVNAWDELGLVRFKVGEERPFPIKPIPADPGVIFSYRQGDWRDNRYEVFQWQDFPSILIFDTANYMVQDNLFKRLAFFVEKAGYRGRLSTDQELKGQHGWNAHDYRAEDLARFFALTETTFFPLLKEEKELEEILFANGILKRDKKNIVIAGQGAVISISRESPDHLRRQFIAHEGFHGLFFIDEDFRIFSKNRFDALSSVARNFIISFFDYQHYDIKDNYLTVNEFQAHILQQSVSQAGLYFGGNLAARIEGSPWRRALLPKKDEASATWPEIANAFQTEAEAFSRYVNKRWGFEAGRNWRVKVIR